MKLQPMIVTHASAARPRACWRCSAGWRRGRRHCPLRTRGRTLACRRRWRAGAAGRADRAGRLGQHELRGAGLHRFPALQRPAGCRRWISSTASTCGASSARPPTATYLPFAALTAIHWTHRSFAFVVIAVSAVARAQARRSITAAACAQPRAGCWWCWRAVLYRHLPPSSCNGRWPIAVRTTAARRCCAFAGHVKLQDQTYQPSPAAASLSCARSPRQRDSNMDSTDHYSQPPVAALPSTGR